MKRNGFTLIELLVVVAIIGILAAVGVVAYNGYTASAKIASVKSNHSSIVKFLSSELKKCEIQGGSIQLKSKGGSQNHYPQNLKQNAFNKNSREQSPSQIKARQKRKKESRRNKDQRHFSLNDIPNIVRIACIKEFR